MLHLYLFSLVLKHLVQTDFLLHISHLIHTPQLRVSHHLPLHHLLLLLLKLTIHLSIVNQIIQCLYLLFQNIPHLNQIRIRYIRLSLLFNIQLRLVKINKLVFNIVVSEYVLLLIPSILSIR